ncbi:MAG TPA: DUF6134 family protein [Geminicoccaceae bacterium]|nr:DUF6134 family protein [Geminicoccaceae bacterium]
MRVLRLALALLVLMAGQATACPDAPDDADYAIHHETHGEVGRHSITFACAGEDLVVETRVTGEVKVLFVPIFQREARYREVWRGDRLIAFDSWFKDNGEVYEVKARAAGDQTIIEGRRGRTLAPSTVVPNHPWNHAVIGRPLLFDIQRGRLQQVRVTPAGADTIWVGGAEVSALKYLVTGDLERELWYGRDGEWLKSRLEYQGAKITLTRQ